MNLSGVSEVDLGSNYYISISKPSGLYTCYIFYLGMFCLVHGMLCHLKCTSRLNMGPTENQREDSWHCFGVLKIRCTIAYVHEI